MVKKKNWYIVHDDLGLFIGEFIGFALWTATTDQEEEAPMYWTKKEGAKEFLNSWSKVSKECKVRALTEGQVKQITTKVIRAS
jgi:hypothetical protein